MGTLSHQKHQAGRHDKQRKKLCESQVSRGQSHTRNTIVPENRQRHGGEKDEKQMSLATKTKETEKARIIIIENA